jgi:general stress protein YciG
MKQGTPEFLEHMRKIGRKGGEVKVPKGFARMDKKKLHAVAVKGGKAGKRGKLQKV